MIVVPVMLASVRGISEKVVDAGSSRGASRHFPAGNAVTADADADTIADAANATIGKESGGDGSVVGSERGRDAVADDESQSVENTKRVLHYGR